MSLLPRPQIQLLAVGVHGGVNFEELERLGLRPEDVLDFSVNANPFGPPPGVREAVARSVIDRYPDPEATALRRRLAAEYGLDVDNILVTNGSVEAIWSACLAYVGPGDCVLVCSPTFGEYEIAARIAGADVMKLNASEEDGFQPDLGRIVQMMASCRPKIVFLCNPNNPTGAYLAKEEIEAILSANVSGLLVLDEAYAGFVRGHWSSIDLIERGNLLVLHSMTKDFTLAGLRLGYALAHAGIIAPLRRVKAPWSVNAPALEAGLAALSQRQFLDNCLERIWEARDYLAQEFRRHGFPVVESRANFFIARVGDARRFRSELLTRGYMVRDCASFGLPEYVRVSPRGMAECQRLVQALEAVASG
ncbi:MAG: histidinol-phosphate transaminase [Dehalococcoidia bacterium]|nr:histidinol-phosphate transaminase [Dehalococcoidia bacterium]